MAKLTLVALVAVLAPPAFAQAVTTYGPATPGSGGFAPRAWVVGEPRLGNAQFHLTLDRATSGAPAALMLGTGAARIPIAGIELLVDPLGVAFLLLPPVFLAGSPAATPGAGSAQTLVAIPRVPQLEGIPLFGQWVVVDGGAPSGLAASDGVHLTLRDQPVIVSASSDVTTVSATGQTFSTPFSVSGGAIPPFPPYFASGVHLTRDGNTAFVLLFSILSGSRVEWYDVSTQPATYLGGAGGYITGIQMHASGEIAYVMLRTYTGAASIATMNVDRSSPSFGRITTVLPNLSQFTAGYALSGDGRRLVYWGLFAPFTIVDIEAGSATQYQTIGTVTPAATLSRVLVSSDGSSAFLVDNSNNKVIQMDLTTGQVLDQVTLADDARDAVLDPRERFLALSLTGVDSIAVIDLEGGPGSYTLRSITASAPTELALAADGATILASTANGYELFDRATGIPFWIAAVPSAASDLALR